MTAAVVPHDGFAFGALCILAIVVIVAMVLVYRGFRGDPKTHRTRLGVVERDRFEDEQDDDPTRNWPREAQQ